MLCVSLAEKSVAEVVRALRGRPFAEVRLDAIEDLDEAGNRRIFGGRGRRIATFRPGRANVEDRIRLLISAVREGATDVDVEIESLAEAGAVLSEAKKRRCRVIVSFHDPRSTPPREELLGIRDRAFAAGADIVKIACRSRGPRDNARLLGLLDDPRPTIVIGMGAAGAITRIAARGLGAPFTYASPRPGRGTAPGQLTAARLVRLWKALDRE